MNNAGRFTQEQIEREKRLTDVLTKPQGPTTKEVMEAWEEYYKSPFVIIYKPVGQ